MNDLEILRDFCAEEAPPGPQELAAVKAKVLAGFGGAAPSRARARVGWASSGRALSLPWPALAGAVAALAGAAIIAALLVPSGAAGRAGERGAGAVQLDAAIVLQRAAQTALTAPMPGNKQFIYAYTVTGIENDGQWVDPGVVREWVSVSGTRPGVIEQGPCLLLPSASDCNRLIAVQKGPFIFTYAGLEKLPTAPGALLDYLYQEQARACSGYRFPVARAQLEFWGIFTILSDVPVLPPRFGEALFDAAAQIPGMAIIKNVRAATGQPGIAVALTSHLATSPAGPNGVEFIFNPRTYRFIGTNSLNPTVPRYAVEGALVASKFVSTAPVGTVGAHSPPLQWQSCPAIPSVSPRSVDTSP